MPLGDVHSQAMKPSQERYVRYFARLMRERFVYSPKAIALLAAEFSECPAVNGLLCSMSPPLSSFSKRELEKTAKQKFSN